MDWSHELIASAFWLLKAYCLVVIFGIIASLCLVRFTSWGRQFWQISGAYFTRRSHLINLIIVALILLFTLMGVRLGVLFSNWYNSLYSSLQRLDESAFWHAMWIFGTLATLHVIRVLLEFYIQQRFTLHWRTWLNERLLAHWLDKQGYYRSQYLAQQQQADNPDQRLQQDIASLVSLTLGLATGAINALVSIFAYSIMLWGLSGVLPLLGYSIPRGMVFLIFVYVLLASVFAFKIGKPLIRLNFLNEQLNANYRYSLMRVREYAENIAFYRGETVEGRVLRHRFNQVIGNAWDIVYRSLKFQGFNLVISQIAVVFPMIIQAQRFFSKQITLGDLMQTAQAFGTLHDSLSFFRNAYDTFASYRAVLNRLSGFDQAIRNANQLPTPDCRVDGQRIALENLTVRRPDGSMLIERANMTIRPGQPLLIRGRSGTGKTTLLRAIAGLWPFSEGQILRPQSQVMFLPQRPYLPLGTLRAALYYPGSPALGGDEAARQALIDVQLSFLLDRLDEVADWSRILSPGEQQRLAFGRLLVMKPLAAFLDEATSAMDEELEHEMYSLLRDRLPDSVLVSVGHRSTLIVHHTQQLLLAGNGRWELSSAPQV